MISFDTGQHCFQLRAAAIFIEHEHVLLHRLVDDDIWALPGGRVEPGEDGATTVMREMNEEIGEAVDCGPLLYVVENFFTHAGRAHHEIGLCYRAQLAAASRLRRVDMEHAGVEGEKALVFAWFPRSQLDGLMLHPAFLKTALRDEPLVWRHVIQRD